MRVTEISVKGLFGVFDHVIPLNLEDRITIIHGPNGVGKTVLLRMIDSFFNRQYQKLHEIPFDQFLITFDDGSTIQISKTEPIPQSGTQQLKATFSNPPAKEEECILNSSKSKKSSEEMEAKEGNEGSLPATGFATNSWKPEPPIWLTERQKAISTHILDTERLLTFHPNKRNGSATSPNRKLAGKEELVAVKRCAANLSEKIQATLSESAQVSNSLERTFPARLVQKAFSPLSGSELSSQLKQLEQEQIRLSSLGLLTNGNRLEFESTLPIDEQNINALSIYVQDAKEKLSVFDKLADKLALLKRIIEQKFLYKKLTIDKEKGLVFATTDNQVIPLNGLSSGEQHELVLLYELLFNAKAGSLILIDEPEISLHLAWQKQFLSDLQQVAALSSFDVILATHSPQIIHDRWDLTVGLKGPNQ